MAIMLGKASCCLLDTVDNESYIALGIAVDPAAVELDAAVRPGA